MCPSLCHFPWNWQMFKSITFRSLYQISPKWDNKCWKYRWKFVYTPNNFMAITVPIFTKLTIAKYVFWTSANIYPNWMKMKKIWKTFIYTLKRNMPIFLKLTLAQQLCVKNCNVNFHENLTGGLVNHSRSWTDGRGSFH